MDLDIFFQRRYKDGQQGHKNLLSITNHQGNTNQNHREISFHTCRNAHYGKDKTSKCWWGGLEKGTLGLCWGACILVQPPRKTVWKALKKLKLKLPYGWGLGIKGGGEGKASDQPATPGAPWGRGNYQSWCARGRCGRAVGSSWLDHLLPGLRRWGLRAVANPAQYVMLAVPDGASDTKLGGVKSRGR